MKIIIDGMGGDNAPDAIVEGAVAAAAETEHEIILVGKEALLKAKLKKLGYRGHQVSVVDAPEVITGEDAPVRAIRKKKDSSMMRGISMVRDGEGDMFISAGNTGALMAGGVFVLGRLKGIDRPAITSIYPVLGGTASLLVDAGANAECRSRNLLEFAMMGSIYMKEVLGRKKPTIGLINIGIEEEKGSAVYKDAYVLLKESSLNFIGNVEARDVPKGKCDVLVCDGFVGNVVLKLTEGMAWHMLKYVKKKFTEGAKAKVGALILKTKLMEVKEDFDYSSYGGAPILGVKGPIVKMHGSSSAQGVKNTILKAIPFMEEDVVGIIERTIGEMSADRPDWTGGEI